MEDRKSRKTWFISPQLLKSRKVIVLGIFNFLKSEGLNFSTPNKSQKDILMKAIFSNFGEDKYLKDLYVMF